MNELIPLCEEAPWGVGRVPFYIAAPTQTLDPDMANGSLIPIEERAPEELTHFEGRQVAAPGIHVRLQSRVG